MANPKRTPESRKKSGRARITNGSELLPSVDGRSIWAQVFRDTLDAMVNHCGGQDVISEPKRMISRRSSVLEVELLHMEDQMAQVRASGGIPEPALLDLYSRLSNTQRRHLEAIGIDKAVIDITPSAAKELLVRKGDVTDVE